VIWTAVTNGLEDGHTVSEPCGVIANEDTAARFRQVSEVLNGGAGANMARDHFKGFMPDRAGV